MRCSKGRAAIGNVIFAPFPVSKSTSRTRRRSLSCWRVVTSGVTHGLRFASCSVSWRTPQFGDGANGWSRRPVALRTVSYPHHREHPAVELGRRGTHRAAQKGAQAQRAVVVDPDLSRKWSYKESVWHADLGCDHSLFTRPSGAHVGGPVRTSVRSYVGQFERTCMYTVG